jgi:3-hydroxyacyl-CoA dehydrogenase
VTTEDLPTLAIVGVGRIGGALLRQLTERGHHAIAIDVDDDQHALAQADVIVEAVPEDAALKSQVIAGFRAHAPDAVVLSTTSSFTTDELAPGDALLGLWHPFAPLSRRRIVEVAAPGHHDAEVLARAVQLAQATDRVWVRCAHRPGLIGNRVLKRWTHAGLSALDHGNAASDVDNAFVSAGFAMGPVSVVSLVGPATSLAVSRSFAASLGHRFAPPESLITAARAGHWPEPGAASLEPSPHLVDDALTAVSDEIARVLDEGVATDASDVRRVVELGLGWPTEIVERLHTW